MDLSTWKDFHVFRTEIRELFELFARRNDKEAFVSYLQSECRSLDPATCDLIGTMTGSKRLQEELKKQQNEKQSSQDKEDETMWKVR